MMQEPLLSTPRAPRVSRVVPVVSAVLMFGLLVAQAAPPVPVQPAELVAGGKLGTMEAHDTRVNVTQQAEKVEAQLAHAKQLGGAVFGDVGRALECTALWFVAKHPEPTEVCADAARSPTVFTAVLVALLLYVTLCFPPVYLFPEAALIVLLGAMLPAVSQSPAATQAALPALRQAALVAGAFAVAHRLYGYLFPAQEPMPVSGWHMSMTTQWLLGFVLLGGVAAANAVAGN